MIFFDIGVRAITYIGNGAVLRQSFLSSGQFDVLQVAYATNTI